MNSLTVKNLTAGYGGKTVLSNVSFAAEIGSIVGVLGANGSGKTTLLKSICGILPHSGECLLNGERLEGLSARKIALRCSYIPQRSGIAIDISALDVVLMGFNARLKLLANPDPSMRKQAMVALETVGLGGQADTNYLHLSEGQKQLCILARTLVSDAQLFLMDEPESALDFRFRYRMLDILRSRIRLAGCTAIVSLHDPALALNCCDQLLLLDGGRCTGMLNPAVDPPEEMERTLSRLYGRITLTVCPDKAGKEQLVMLKEQEAAPCSL